jgi:gamma-butyrobetaine dioxygenase
LHCVESKVHGGLSTLVDGLTVTEDLKSNHPEFYKILTEIKVKFKFIDKDVVLENWSPLIELSDEKKFKQVRFSPRLDFVPILDKEKLDLYYKARNKLSEMYNSDKYKIEFKLSAKDLIMMDNYRLLHGRTAYQTSEGERFLQGCYIDYDSTEGKLRHLKRKFNL